MITRRCNDRQFFLHPCKSTNQIVLYALAVAQKKHGILIHAFCVMSNHWHAYLTDTNGNLPDFLRDVHTTIARCVNRLLDRRGPVFEAKQTHRLEMASLEDHVSEASYVIANPVAAGLVESPELWPGLVSTRFDQNWEVDRPEVYFDLAGNLPEKATLQMSLPQIESELRPEQIQALLDNAVAERVAVKKSQMRGDGERFVGAEAVLKMGPSAKATSRETTDDRTARVAAKDTNMRSQLIKKAQEWVRSYREALKAWTDGLRETVFPAGTWQMHRQFGVTKAVLEIV